MPPIVDTLHLCIALIPLAIYLFIIGFMNLVARPIVLSGAKDAAGLGLAVSGFILAGPMELLQPTATSFKIGGFIWILLISFYLLSLTLVILLMRPRIVIYNVGHEQIRPALANCVSELDPEARWAGDCLYLPNLGVQLHVDSFALVRNVQLVSMGAVQSLEGWSRLERTLRMHLRRTTGPRNLYGLSFVVVGLSLIAALTVYAVHDVETVVQSLEEMLHVEE